MKKVNSKINKNGRRGFTMVELVVALAIIAIVSIATVFLIITQTNMNAKSIQVVEATNVAENAIECFRFAVNVSGSDEAAIKSNFESAFKKSLGLGEGEELKPKEETDEYVIYEIIEHGATIEITIKGNEITIKAIASDRDIIIEKKTYTKYYTE